MKNICQSCGMPMKQDPNKGGTNSDGTKNTEYCSYCFQNGAFTSPEIDTPQKMQKFCIEKMKEMGMPGFVAWIFTRGIPKLKRWK
ncbi:MAG: zinc ribbon domain-containing protein [Desulfobacteraceae bacterium]|nr:zinc ribbon domain-containing protein [Desulfobacteraceae bacterium]